MTQKVMKSKRDWNPSSTNLTAAACRTALAQVNSTVGDLAGNREKILAFVAMAKIQHADLVVFPELVICGYPPEDLLHKEYFVQDNVKSLRVLARKIKGITAVVGFVDIEKDKRIYNAAAVIANGKILGTYHKRELPNYGVFDEKRYFSEGNNLPLFALGKTVLGVNICEDIWVDKGVHREQAQAGARILVNLSSSPYDFGKQAERVNLLVEQAQKCRAFVCYTNMVGGQDELVFDGGSLVVSPKGEILASGKQFEEDLVVVDLDVKSYQLSAVRYQKRREKAVVLPVVKRRGERAVLGPHITKHYSKDERILRALVLGTRDYIRKNGFEKVVIGLSGGIDSSLVAAIAVEAVGRENVVGVSMPSDFTSKGTKSDAKKLAGNLGIRFIEIPIQGIFSTYLFVLREEFAGTQLGVAEENLQARIRGTLLMTFSNKFGWLVLTTGNKSEVAVGYCTLYGDMTGGFAVIKDVPKTKVYTIAKLINSQNGEIIPRSVITRAPTAELRKNQKDEDSLPSYEILDPLVKAYVEDHKSLAQMARVCNNKKLIKEIVTLVDRSEYKRRQSPPGIKITPRAFGKDWRLPITNKYKEY